MSWLATYSGPGGMSARGRSMSRLFEFLAAVLIVVAAIAMLVAVIGSATGYIPHRLLP